MTGQLLHVSPQDGGSLSVPAIVKSNILESALIIVTLLQCKFLKIQIIDSRHTTQSVCLVMFLGLIFKTILLKIVNIKDQNLNEFSATLLLQQTKTFEEMIADRIKKDSALIQICKDNFSSDYIRIGRRMLKRIQTAKFRQYWITLPHVTAKQNKINSPHDQSQIDDKFPSSSFVASFLIERSKIFNSSGELKVKGREWTQNIYDKLPSKEINCSLAIKKKLQWRSQKSILKI